MPDRRPLITQIACCGLIVAVSAAYYSRYADAGFNYADDGNYAQICAEILRGRDLHALSVNYGILWFKIGELLFRLFGVNYALIQALFFGCITITNLLVFAAVMTFTGSAAIGLAIAAVPLLVPAFPATAFYGLCVLLNVAAQMRFAGAMSSRTAALAGVALSVTFQLRPDFGYSFAVPLAILFVIAARRHAGWRDMVIAAVGGFVVAFAPMIIAAALGGYLDVLAQQAIDYPRLMVSYFAGGVERLIGGSAVPATAATFLERPSPAAILGRDGATALLALLIYLPVAGLTAFAIYLAATWRRSVAAKQWDVLGQSVVAVCAAAATLPHYFLFRPDISHVANFMSGYVVFAAFFLWRLSRPNRAWSMIRRAGAAMTAGILILDLALYGAVGLGSRGTGSIGLAADRAEPFHARNGVDVRVDPAEKAQLALLQDAIEHNSQPGDDIVCLPYCPGVAFMTDRRMLLAQFFADDSFPVRMPEWLPQAIAQTRAARPPVVVIIDWATNGTEQSRFSVWAADYMAAMESLATGKIARGAVTIYLLGPRPDPPENPGSP